jgi:hypothetical protein
LFTPLMPFPFTPRDISLCLCSVALQDVDVLHV